MKHRVQPCAGKPLIELFFTGIFAFTTLLVAACGGTDEAVAGADDSPQLAAADEWLEPDSRTAIPAADASQGWLPTASPR